MLRLAGSFALAAIALANQLAGATPVEPRSYPEPIPGELRLINLYRDYSDTVVKVKFAIKSIDENGKEQVALTVQSGFYIDSTGTVLTNAVPTHKGPRLRIEKDGLQLLAVPIASDAKTNIALLQVAKPPSEINYIEVEQGSSTVPVGSLAYAITSPLELGPTPKLGIVTGRESSFNEIEFPCTYTRIGVSSGPAEGGSPVFASDGSLMGISVASLPDVNSSYIVPTRSLRHIVSQLRKYGSVFHANIEVRVSERTHPNTLRSSLVVSELKKDSAASQAGLKEGDQILSFQGKEISNLNEWRDALFFSQAGQFASLAIRRGEEEKEIALLLESE